MANFRRSTDERAFALKGKHNSNYYGGPGLDTNRRLTKLYIRNVPTTYVEDDLEYIFQEYGNIKSLFIGPAKPMQKFTWAIVEYDHYKNAELAVSELDGCPPYNFLVSYSRTDEEKQSIQLSKQQEYEHAYENVDYNQINPPPRRSFGRVATYVDDDNSDDLIYDQTHVSRHHGNNWDSKINMSNMKLVVLNKSGERQITMGQPSVSLSTLGPMIPIDVVSQDTRQTIDEAITNMMIQLQKKSDKGDNNDGVSERCGSCAVCGTITVNACNRCQLWYCGRKCQVKDWPHHMNHCAPLPDLQCMKKDNAVVAEDERKFKPTSVVTNKSEVVDEKDEGQFGNKNRNYNKFQDNQNLNDRDSNFEDRNRGFADRNNKFGDSNKSFADRTNKYGDSNKGFADRTNKYGDSNKGFADRTNKYGDSNKGFADRTNKYGDSNKGFADRTNKYGDSNKSFGDRTNKFGDNQKGFGDNRSNDFDNRSSYLDDKNKTFSDRNRNFEDRNKGMGQDKNRGFGNKPFGDNRNNEPFKTDRRDFVKTDRYNPETSNTSENEKDSFWDNNIKKTSTPNKDDSTSKSTVSPTPYALVETPKFVEPRVEAQIPASLRLLPIGITKEVTIVGVLEPGHYWVHVNELEKEYKEMFLKLNIAALNAKSVTPVEKMKCMVQYDEMWYRGMVKSVSPLQVSLVDYGNCELVTADQIKAIPEEFAKFQRMAVRIKLAPGTRKDFYNKKEDDIMNVKPTTRDVEGVLIVEAMDPAKQTTNREEITSSASTSATPSVFNHVLPADVFSKVVVTHVESKTELWVQSLSQKSKSALGHILKVSNEKSNAEPFTPKLGAKCFGLYLGEWYRAEVTSLSPLKVHYIDFGNEEECTVGDLRVLPSEISLLPPLACKIYHADGLPLEIFSEVEVKPISQDNNVITVLIRDTSEAVASASGSKTDAKFSEQNNVVELLKKDSSGLIEVCQCLNNNRFIVSIKCSEMSDLNDKLTALSNELEGLPHDQSFKPKVSEVVGVQYKDPEDGTLLWGRAVQYLKDKFTLCDEGLEITPLQLKKIPANYDNIPYIAGFCTLETPKVSENLIKDTYFKVGSSMFFTVTKVIDDMSVEAILQDDRKTINVAQVILKPWQPYLFVPSSELKSGSNVTLSSFYSFDELYVLIVNPESLGFLNQLKEHVENQPPLNGNPNIGDVVACFVSRDKLWYRAKILNKNGDEYEVFYVDYGKKATCTVANMKTLPRTYKNIPFHAIKVGLANKLDKSLTKDALAFLTRISQGGESLTIENDDLTSVVLLRENGNSINDELNNIIDPNWAKQQQEPQDTATKRLMINQLPKNKIAEGTVVELSVLVKTDPKGFVAFDVNSQVVNDVLRIVTGKLSTYCKHLPSSSYKPVPGELCAAIFHEDSLWYRALCMETMEDESTVMFIDYGNECTVKHINIRELNEELISYPAMGYICVYQNEHIEAISKDASRSAVLDKRINELVKVESKYTVSVKKEDNDTYLVDIPSVTLILQEEGLL